MTGQQERDRWLRDNVIEKLVLTNERWPGLWTRLESLLDERDALQARADKAEEALDAMLTLAERLWGGAHVASTEYHVFRDHALAVLAARPSQATPERSAETVNPRPSPQPSSTAHGDAWEPA